MQLPTDNLYKFMAISGLSLVIASFYFSISISREVEVIKEWNINQDYDYSADSLREEAVRRMGSALISNLGARRTTGETKGSSFKDSVKAFQDSIQTVSRSMQELFFQHDRQAAINGERLSKWAKLEDENNWLLRIGIFVAWVGFYFWFFRLQRHQDALVRRGLRE